MSELSDKLREATDATMRLAADEIERLERKVLELGDCVFELQRDLDEAIGTRDEETELRMKAEVELKREK